MTEEIKNNRIKNQGKIAGDRDDVNVSRPGILIASLGDSPVIVSSMYYLLTEREIIIDRVVVLVPDDKEAGCAYDLVKEALSDKVELKLIKLNFQDADSSQHARSFLHELYKLLDMYEKLGDSVYLSLAGGRKSMAALMAWVAPLFSSVKKLYHVIDTKENDASLEHFKSAYDIQLQAASKRSALMHPELNQLLLVTIPFEKGQGIGEKLHSRLLSSRPDDYEEAESLITTETIVQQGDIPELKVSRKVIAQFQALCQQDEIKAESVRNGLLEMSRLTKLRDYKIENETYSYKVTRASRVTLYYFTGLQVQTRPVFYTIPANSADQIEQIVICSLEEVGANGYKTLKEVATSPDFAVNDLFSIDMLPPVPSPAESVLIVALGKSPMIATQLYTLLTEQEKHVIHEIILIYPERSTEILNGAEFIQKLLKRRDRDIVCNLVPIPGLEDITDEDECRQYQEFLEGEIDRVWREYSTSCKIDLALSGGRKGMTAMTIFAAQKKHIPYVYHTLITDEPLGSDEKTSDEIEDETTYKNLRENISLQEAYDRLFLHAYRSEGQNPYSRFVLFRVPILPSNADPEKIIPLDENITGIPKPNHGSIVVYFSYVKEDSNLFMQLQDHLNMLTRNKLITIWHRVMILGGGNKEAEWRKHLNGAHIILLLVSSRFMASECYDEAELAMQLRETKGVVVIPINYRPIDDWPHMVFGELQPLPKTGKAIMEYLPSAKREKCIQEVAKSIREVVEGLNAKQQ